MSQTPGTIFIVVAPSGAGKTTLVRALLESEPDVALSVSYTTRQPREGEINGKHYHFVDRATFEGMIAAGDFLEHAEVFGNYYGTSSRWIREQIAVGRDILLEIDCQGARQVREILPEAVAIFILPPSMTVLESRLRGRATDSEEVILRRLSEARKEIDQSPEYDYLIVNDEFETARLDLISVVRSQRLQRDKQLLRHGTAIAGMQSQPQV